MADENTGANDPKDMKEDEAAKLLREREENSGIEYDEVAEDEYKKDADGNITSLGTAEAYKDHPQSAAAGDITGGNLGWKPMPIENIPSQGRFYPEGTTLEIRAAQVQEIRHFSTIDENDPLDMDDKLNMIVDKCMRMRFPDRHATWKDLKEEDRFYLIFAIRDLTFVNGENKLFLTLKCGRECVGDGSYNERVELVKENFEYYEIDDKLMQYYNPEERCFVVDSPKVGTIRMYIPSLGITTFIKNHIRKKVRDNEFFDKAFLKLAPFVFPDWRSLDAKAYQAKVQESMGWSPLKLSAMLRMAEMIRFGVKTELRRPCKQCGVEVHTPLNFPGGVKSLFLPADPFDELFT